MRRIAMLTAAAVLAGGMAVLGAAPAQAAPQPRTNCFTTQPVVPRGAPTPAAPKHCGKNTKPRHHWLAVWR